jgi:DNA-binding NtrC family response regulator
MMGTVLAVHDDLAILFALAVRLEGRTIALVPARSVNHAKVLLQELRFQPDVLLINCAKRGTGKFAAAMRECNPALAVVGITSGRHQCKSCRKLLSATVEGSSERQLEELTGLIERLIVRGRATAQ